MFEERLEPFKNRISIIIRRKSKRNIGAVVFSGQFFPIQNDLFWPIAAGGLNYIGGEAKVVKVRHKSRSHSTISIILNDKQLFYSSYFKINCHINGRERNVVHTVVVDAEDMLVIRAFVYIICVHKLWTP